MSYQIVAFDIGVTTGVAWLKDGQIEASEADTEAVYQLLELPWEEVVYEQFSASGRVSKYGITTIELAGSIKALCARKGIPCIGQAPQYRRAFMEDAKRQLKGRNRSPHMIDAMAHLLRRMYDRGKIRSGS